MRREFANGLTMRRGKEIAQGSHASMAGFVKSMKASLDPYGFVEFKLTDAQIDWITGNFRKIVLQVKSEEDLMVIYNKCKELGLPVELIVDSGLTEFKEPTTTCLAIGPEDEDKIDEVTGLNGPLGKLNLL